MRLLECLRDVFADRNRSEQGVRRARCLFGIDLRVEAGDRIGFVGANGAGKTTLLRILASRRSPPLAMSRASAA
jgi:ATPase subunit of ABC transporter with duplicated ATPase domains